MRINPSWGCDTGMCLVDVLLETPQELLFDDEQIARAARDLATAQGIDLVDVVDFFTHVRNGRGEWVSATRSADGKLIPVS